VYLEAFGDPIVHLLGQEGPDDRTAACDRLWRSKDLQGSSTEPNATEATTALPQVGPSARPGHA